MRGAVVMLILSSLLLSCLRPAAAKDRVAKATAELPGSSGAIDILSVAGVKSPKSIQAAIIMYPSRATYKITRQSAPALLDQISSALQSAYRVPAYRPGWLGSITLVMSDGRAVWFSFSDEPLNTARTVFIMGRYTAPGLLKPLEEIKNSVQAATMDWQVGEFAVDSLEVRPPRSSSVHRVAATSKEGAVLVAKAKDIVDLLDVRSARARSVSSRDIGSAEAKFGCLTLYLSAPQKLCLEVWDDMRAPRTDPDPAGHNVSSITFRCDRIRVLDYGNYLPPLVAFKDMGAPDTYYLCSSLTRREQEKYLVANLGYPGHPTSDREYYKNPAVLYNELQELIIAAYEAQAM